MNCDVFSCLYPKLIFSFKPTNIPWINNLLMFAKCTQGMDEIYNMQKKSFIAKIHNFSMLFYYNTHHFKKKLQKKRKKYEEKLIENLPRYCTYLSYIDRYNLNGSVPCRTQHENCFKSINNREMSVIEMLPRAAKIFISKNIELTVRMTEQIVITKITITINYTWL